MSPRWNETAQVRSIQVDELRGMLEHGDPVQVVDIRPADERADWFIPGSIHLDVYQELQGGGSRRLETLGLAHDVPVVAVCAAGRTSRIAARVLGRLGYDVRSLDGGMTAWSLAWNTAEVAGPGDSRLVQVRRTGKGCLAYLVASGTDAIVVDASLEPRRYVELADVRGWTIRHVLDTHIHADHLSRSRALALLTGAMLWMPEQNRVHYPYQVLRDGYELDFGATTLHALATPGHTPESMSYVIGDRWLLTGDTLFPSAVGRPDLGTDAAGTRMRAGLLFVSLQRLRALDAALMVLPAHAPAPVAFDGVLVGAQLGDVLHAGPMPAGAAEFTERVLDRLPMAPANHAIIIACNEAGQLPGGDIAELEAGANRCALS